MSRVDLFSLITQFTRSTDTRRSSRAHRGVRGALVPGLVTESRADGLESRRLCGPGGYHPWSRPEQHRAENLQVCRSRSGTDSEAKTLAQVKPRSRSRRAAASTTTSQPQHVAEWIRDDEDVQRLGVFHKAAVPATNRTNEIHRNHVHHC